VATMPTRVVAIRQELGRQSKDLAGLLKLARAVDLGISDHHPLATAFMVLDSVAASESATLPTGAIQPFGVTWKCLIEQQDRTAALGCYRAATLHRRCGLDHHGRPCRTARAPQSRGTLWVSCSALSICATISVTQASAARSLTC